MIFQDYSDAIDYHRKAIQLKKSDTDQNLNNIGLAYFEEGNYTEAMNYLNQALQKNPYNYHAKVNLALVYKELGNLDKAIAIL